MPPDQSQKPVVVVGAAGFIGRALAERLAARGVPVIAVVRRAITLAPAIAVQPVGDVGAATNWAPLLEGARAVVHLASRAHAPIDTDLSWADKEATAAAHLVREAKRAGVERLVFMSSIKVLGEVTSDSSFSADRIPAPQDVYGVAKKRIEEVLNATTAGGPALTVIRPPLVYGPGVKANFHRLLRLVDSGVPLPFASIVNRRSLIFLDNLLDLVEATLQHPGVTGGVFLARDDQEVSTPDLVRHIARQLGRAARLFPCPPALLRFSARIIGRSAAAERLLGSLSVDDRATRDRFGWRPRFTLDEGLAITCRAYRRAGSEKDGSAAADRRL